MTSRIKVDEITNTSSDTPAITVNNDDIVLNKPLKTTTGEQILSTSISGQVLQIAAQQHYNGGGHYSVSGTSLSSGQSYGPGCDITVKSQTSVNMVDFWSSMAYGAAGALIWNLEYSVNGGSSWGIACGTHTYGTNVVGNPTTDTPTSLKGSQGHQPNYGWTYDSSGWGPRLLRFFHDHNQPLGTTIRYRITGYNNGSGQANYILHANYQVMSFTVTEIGEIG